MIELNINDFCFVQLTDAGREALKRQHDELNTSLNGCLGDYTPIKEDKDGWSKWQMYSLMQQLGYMLKLGDRLPFKTRIKIGIQEDLDSRIMWYETLSDENKKALLRLADILNLPELREYENRAHLLINVYSRIGEASSLVRQLTKA